MKNVKSVFPRSFSVSDCFPSVSLLSSTERTDLSRLRQKYIWRNWCLTIIMIVQIVALVHICVRLGISFISYLWRFRSFLVKNFLSHWPQTNFLSRDPFMVLDPAWTFRWFISSSCKYKYKSSAPPTNTNKNHQLLLEIQIQIQLPIFSSSSSDVNYYSTKSSENTWLESIILQILQSSWPSSAECIA